jgi:hypothetical protein
MQAQAKGTGTPAFTHSGLLLPDHEGVYVDIADNSAPWHGARKVTNWLRAKSNDFQDAEWEYGGGTTFDSLIVGGGPNGEDAAEITIPNNGSLYDSVNIPVSYHSNSEFSIWMRTTSGTADVTLRVAGTNRGPVTVDTTWKRYTADETTTFTVNRINGIRNSSGAGYTIQIANAQLETGLPSAIPSEYVDKTTSGLDTSASAYYANLNGNKVLTNIATYSNDCTNAGWTAQSVTAAFDQTGLSGDPNTASSIIVSSSGNYRGILKTTEFITANVPVTVVWTVKHVSGAGWVFTNAASYGGLNLEQTWFDIINGTVGTQSAGTVNAAIDDIGNGIFRIYVEYLMDPTDLNGRMELYLANSDTAVAATLNDEITVFNMEAFDNKTLAEVQGSNPIITTSAAKTELQEFTGAALATQPSLYAAPALTNLVQDSRDLRTAGWWSGSTLIAPEYDQAGIQGEPNTATELFSDAGGYNNASAPAVTVDAGSAVARFMIKKDSDETRFPQFNVPKGAPMDVRLNTATGATHIASGTSSVEVESVGDWWVLYIQNDGTQTSIAVSIFPAASTTLTGSASGSVVGSIIVGSVELFSGKTIAEVKGAAPIVTAGTTVTSTAVVCAFDLLNHDNAQGAYYCEEYRFGPSGVNVNVITPYNGASFGRIMRTGGLNLVSSYINPSEGGAEASVTFTTNQAQWSQFGCPYDSNSNEISMVVKNPTDGQVDGTKQTNYSYFRTTSEIDLLQNVTKPGLIRNIQRWDLPYTDAKAKIDELMA